MLTSYLNPRTTVKLFSGSVPFTLGVLTPITIRHPDFELHRSSHPIVVPLSGLGLPGQKSSVLPASTACPELAILTPSTCYPGPCPLLHPHATRLFLPSCPPSSRSHFSALKSGSAPVNSCGLSFLGYVLSLPVLEPPRLASTVGPVPYGPEGVCASSRGLLPSSIVLPLDPMLFRPIYQPLSR